VTPFAGAKLTAFVCCLVALTGAAALGVLVLLLGLHLLPEREPLPPPTPWLIDIGWLFLFGVQHSGMARRSFKRFWTTLLPDYLERSTYVAASGLLIIGLVLTWQPIEGNPLWQLPRGLVVVPLLAVAGMVAVSLRFDHLEFFSLRQVWHSGREPDRLLVLGPYRYVRHPLMTCLLVFLWAQPVMTPTLLLLSGGLSVYIVLGTLLEERDLRRRFGAAYAGYRRRVPALLPWRPPAPPATYPAPQPE
jgi:protein-S-isoprenylcysteine O-methyltransferase Ste14